MCRFLLQPEGDKYIQYVRVINIFGGYRSYSRTEECLFPNMFLKLIKLSSYLEKFMYVLNSYPTFVLTTLIAAVGMCVTFVYQI